MRREPDPTDSVAQIAVKDAATEPAYSWTFPGSPVRIRIAITLVQYIQDAISAMLSAEVPADQELWGVLLGQAHSRGVIDIVDVKSIGYHPVTAAAIEARGPDWERAFDELGSTNSDLSVVGYFRTARDGR